MTGEDTPQPGNGVLLLSCPDGPGIVHAVTDLLVRENCSIVQSQQFGSGTTGNFYLRTEFARVDGSPVDLDALALAMAPIAERFDMTWKLTDTQERPRVLIMVSKGAQFGVRFEHLPVTKETKAQQEQQALQLVRESGASLVVLARYMQILSNDFLRAYEGDVINIHHSFLPAFVGGKPYHRAYERGVKLIGATAHYATADLDEGPIIEQELIRVDHSQSPEQLATRGREAERSALTRAVRWHSENRIVIVGNRTVVFP
jgi:formyltetrahydrofolate deformylase